MADILETYTFAAPTVVTTVTSMAVTNIEELTSQKGKRKWYGGGERVGEGGREKANSTHTLT